jgi:probable HAF family extracellular repeat protein
LLPGLPGSDFAQPVGINIRGEITGYANDATNTTNTVLWKQGTVTLIVPNSAPTGINDEGEVVGTTRTEPTLPFLWKNGVTTTLPALPGLLPYGAAQSINDLGQVVGTSSNFPVLWQNGTAVNLNNQIAPTDPLQPYVHLQNATFINNLGQIVATGTDSRNPTGQQLYLLTPAR